MSDSVLVERHGGVLVMQINRPNARNAINHEVAVGLAAAVDELTTTAALVVGVLTGAGGTFSAGMDLKAFLVGETVEVADRGLAGIARTPPAKPLIAAVEGWALAGGFELALACDLIVASTDARFGLPEVKRGLVAGGGGPLRLPRKIPSGLAMELALTAHRCRPETQRGSAWSTGWSNRVGPLRKRSSWRSRSPPTVRWPSRRPSSWSTVRWIDRSTKDSP